MFELGNSLLLNSATRARVRPVVYGFCISVAVCATAFIPVMAFTFLGLTGSPYVRETNPLFAGYIATSGLVTGLFLAFVTNLLAAAGILALVHLLFYRPVIFYEPGNVALGRKLVVVGGGLFLLTWGQKFFLDSYHDMRVLSVAQIGSSDLLWTIFLGCLILFAIGVVYWAMTLFSEFRVKEVGEKREDSKSRINSEGERAP